MNQSQTTPAPWSIRNVVLSTIIPGLGQAVGGAISRGIIIFISLITMSALTVWTAAQRARFPDYAVSLRAFLFLLAETAAILIFLQALAYLLRRSFAKEPTQRALINGISIIVSALAIGLVSDLLIDTALPLDQQQMIYGLTATLGAALVAAIWLWNIADASKVTPEGTPSLTPMILLLTLTVLFLGSQITEVNVSKAVREYKDTQIILRRIVWPWRSAFHFDSSDVRAEAKIQAPCISEAEAPPVNQPKENGPWIVATPTCGETSTRDTKGKLTLGTKLTIEGGGFVPGKNTQIQWINPIGNPFTPRGVGEVEFRTDDKGAFTTELYIPETTIPEVAEGPQIHTLVVVQRGEEKFTGQLSREMKLALQGMLESIMMGLVATFAGIALSIPFSFLAARNLMSTIRSSLEGFIGGVLGLLAGGWVGKRVADLIVPIWGGLDRAPIPTALVYLLLTIGLALVAFSLVAKILDRVAERAPMVVSKVISIIGLALIGAGVGYGLGLGYAHGILGISRGAEYAALVDTRYGIIGSLIIAAIFGYWALRIGARGEMPTGQLVYAGIRTALNIVRSIEVLIWGLIAVIWVGPGPFAGVIALTLHSIAALGKLYSEAIESINPGPIEALTATGANRLQTVVYAVIPQVLPPFISFTIYRWDINIRMSTVIGLIGGGGIGFLLIQWIRQFQYDAAGIAVWLITITVASLDFISAAIRERFV